MASNITIHRGNRVVHKLYGRGLVARLHHVDNHAGVNFDDDRGIARRVRLADLVREPAAMPPCRTERPELRAAEAIYELCMGVGR